MKKLGLCLQWLLSKPLMILAFIYTYWLVSTPTSMVVWGFGLFGVYFVITIFEKVFRNNQLISFILHIVVLLLMLPVFGYMLITCSFVLDYGIENITSIIVFIVSAILIFYELFEKLKGDDHILSKIMFVATTPLFFLNVLYFVLFYPTTLDIASLGSFKYYAVSELDGDIHSFNVFYRCRKWSFECDRLYSTIGYGDTKIIVDNQMNEVSLYENSTLQYTDAPHPRYYQGYDVLLNNYRYVLGWTCDKVNPIDCDDVVYVPYQCELDFTVCIPLPIQYVDYYDNYYLTLIANEAMGEINLIEDYEDESVLIFTYGSNSRCYVDNCEILEK